MLVYGGGLWVSSSSCSGKLPRYSTCQLTVKIYLDINVSFILYYNICTVCIRVMFFLKLIVSQVFWDQEEISKIILEKVFFNLASSFFLNQLFCQKN